LTLKTQFKTYQSKVYFLYFISLHLVDCYKNISIILCGILF